MGLVMLLRRLRGRLPTAWSTESLNACEQKEPAKFRRPFEPWCLRGRQSSLILNLPGSPSGATESLTAVVDVLPHALDLLAGKTAHKP